MIIIEQADHALMTGHGAADRAHVGMGGGGLHGKLPSNMTTMRSES